MSVISENFNQISLSDKYCNICTENIESDKLVTLACNPNHYFCYTCIFDWFDSIKNGFSYDNKQCTCPICKKDGGVLPVLPPHTKPIVGVHVIGKTPLLNKGPCKHKDCTISAYEALYSKPNEQKIKKIGLFCIPHYKEYKNGKNLILNDDTIFETPYVHCNCKMPNNNICENSKKYDKITSVSINNKLYYLCNEHEELYYHGIELTFDDDVKSGKPTNYKNNIICGFPNDKLKYGYCLHKVDCNNLCKVNYHNTNKINLQTNNDEDNDIFGDSDTESEAKPKIMNVHIGLCGATLKNGSGTCKNKSKAEYNGKCGKHKNC